MLLTKTVRLALLAAPAVALALAGAVSAADPMAPAGAMASDHMGASGAMASDNMAASGAMASDHMATGAAPAADHMAAMPMKAGRKHHKHHPMSAMSADPMAR